MNKLTLEETAAFWVGGCLGFVVGMAVGLVLAHL